VAVDDHGADDLHRLMVALFHMHLPSAAVEVAFPLRTGVLDDEAEHGESASDQQRRGDPERVVATLAGASPAPLLDRVGPELLLDDRLLEAEVALSANREQLVRAPQVENLRAVGRRQAIDHKGIASGQPHERVGPRALGAKAVLVQLDGAFDLDDPGEIEAACEDTAGGRRSWMPRMDPAATARGRRGVAFGTRRLHPAVAREPWRAALRRGKALDAVIDHDPPRAQAIQRSRDERDVTHNATPNHTCRSNAPETSRGKAGTALGEIT
jgi:hypothetical protein